MDFVFRPSLQHMALVKIAISICSRDINDPFKFSEVYRHSEEAAAVETLPLPKQLKEQVSRFILPINKEIERWYHHFRVNFDLLKRTITGKEIVWTSVGTVDEKKSAAILARDLNLDPKTRYKLACNYCLETKIFELFWKRGLLGGDLDKNEEDDDLVVFWTHYIKLNRWELEKLMRKKGLENASIYYLGFRLALWQLNPTAIQYFFAKLDAEERAKSISCCFVQLLEESPEFHFYMYVGQTAGRFVEIYLFALRQMSEDKRMEIWRKYYQALFACLLLWPYPHLFLKLSVDRRMKELIAPNKFYFFLNSILYKINRGYDNCLYRDVFGEFWRSSRAECKNYMFDGDWRRFWYILMTFIHAGEMDLCRLMLRDADGRQKERLFLDEEAHGVYETLMRQEKFDFIEFFEKEVFDSSDERSAKLKEMIHKLRNNLELRMTYGSSGQLFMRYAV